MASCTGALAERELTGHTGTLALKISGDLPQADAETEADMIVWLHQPSLGG